MEQLKKENLEFVENWESNHKRGIKKYILKKMVSCSIMMFFIFLINMFVNEVTNYFLSAMIYVLIVIVTPFLSWTINENRYKKYRNL